MSPMGPHDSFIEQRLAELVDSTLDPDQCRALRELLEQQPELKREVEELRRLRELLRSVPKQAVPDGFTARLMGRIELLSGASDSKAPVALLKRLSLWQLFGTGSLASGTSANARLRSRLYAATACVVIATFVGTGTYAVLRGWAPQSPGETARLAKATLNEGPLATENRSAIAMPPRAGVPFASGSTHVAGDSDGIGATSKLHEGTDPTETVLRLAGQAALEEIRGVAQEPPARIELSSPPTHVEKPFGGSAGRPGASQPKEVSTPPSRERTEAAEIARADDSSRQPERRRFTGKGLPQEPQALTAKQAESTKQGPVNQARPATAPTSTPADQESTPQLVEETARTLRRLANLVPSVASALQAASPAAPRTTPSVDSIPQPGEVITWQAKSGELHMAMVVDLRQAEEAVYLLCQKLGIHLSQAPTEEPTAGELIVMELPLSTAPLLLKEVAQAEEVRFSRMAASQALGTTGHSQGASAQPEAISRETDSLPKDQPFQGQPPATLNLRANQDLLPPSSEETFAARGQRRQAAGQEESVSRPEKPRTQQAVGKAVTVPMRHEETQALVRFLRLLGEARQRQHQGSRGTAPSSQSGLYATKGSWLGTPLAATFEGKVDRANESRVRIFLYLLDKTAAEDVSDKDKWPQK
jgi:hypothetical protein